MMRTVILNFHGIGVPARRLEPGESRFWIAFDAYRAILDAVVANTGDEAPAVWITFDDGNRSDLDLGAPELAARGLAATFFPLAGRLAAPGSLGAQDLRDLRAAGHRIGTHGYDHLDFRRLTPSGVLREFDSARTTLAGIAAGPVDEIAIPFGHYDRGVLRALRARSYSAVYTSDRGVMRGMPWIRPRTCVRADMGAEAVRAILAGRENIGRRAHRAASMARKRLL